MGIIPLLARLIFPLAAIMVFMLPRTLTTLTEHSLITPRGLGAARQARQPLKTSCATGKQDEREGQHFRAGKEERKGKYSFANTLSHTHKHTHGLEYVVEVFFHVRSKFIAANYDPQLVNRLRNDAWIRYVNAMLAENERSQ